MARRRRRACGWRFAMVAMLLLAEPLSGGLLWADGELPAGTEPAAGTLRIIPREPTAFAVPGLPLACSAQVDRFVEHASQQLQLRSFLVSLADGKQVATARQSITLDARGSSASIPLEFQTPDQPGVYELRCELSKESELTWNPFRRKVPPLLQAGRPLVVVSPLAASGNLPVMAGRTALLHLPSLDWISELTGGTDPPPGCDEQAWQESTPRTQTAARLWLAVGQLQQYLLANELQGVALPKAVPWEADLPASRWRELGGAFDADPLDTLRRVCAAHEIQTTIGPPEGGSFVPLGKSLAALPTDPPTTADRGAFVLASVIAHGDPRQLVLNYPVGAGPLSEPVRALLKGYRALPLSSLTVVSPADPALRTVVVRTAIDQGHAYLGLLSLAPWTSEVDLQFDPAAAAARIEWQSFEATADDNPVSLAASPQHRIVLGPGELKLLRSAAPIDHIELKSWTARLQGGAVQGAKIKADVTAIVQRIGLLTNLPGSPALANGGFEQLGELGIVAWMHAQYPPGCVTVDQSQSVEGEHSILLFTDPNVSARTWMVSEPIAPPATSRLAVSLAIRAERSDGAPPHQLRVSLESARRGQPVRYANEIEVPRNGDWNARRMVLEIDGIDHSQLDSWRLTIDSKSAGRVWIDDIRVHHWFATAKEREELQSLAFLAVQGLQHGDLTPSARLLVNPWAQYLLSRPGASAEPASPPAAAKPPGVAQRIRNWLPEPIRF